jgi:hypothetical protein
MLQPNSHQSLCAIIPLLNPKRDFGLKWFAIITWNAVVPAGNLGVKRREANRNRGHKTAKMASFCNAREIQGDAFLAVCAANLSHHSFSISCQIETCAIDLFPEDRGMWFAFLALAT